MADEHGVPCAAGGIDHSFLILIGTEPSMGWQDFMETILAFCHRNKIETAITLHSAPANVSHRLEAPVMGVYGSQELEASFRLPPTVFQDGPMSFAAVLSLNLNAQGVQTADLIALEPFYTPGLPDAGAALSLVRVLDRTFGTTTPLEGLTQTATEQRQAFEAAMGDTPHLRALADRLEQQSNAPALLQMGGEEELSISDVMNEVGRILGT